MKCSHLSVDVVSWQIEKEAVGCNIVNGRWKRKTNKAGKFLSEEKSRF
jgi:hypothetical protein